MERSEIQDKVLDVIAEQLGIRGIVPPEDNLRDDLGADSLDIVEMVMGLEEKFNIEIPDEDGDKVKTVSDVVDLVEKIKGDTISIKEYQEMFKNHKDDPILKKIREIKDLLDGDIAFVDRGAVRKGLVDIYTLIIKERTKKGN